MYIYMQLISKNPSSDAWPKLVKISKQDDYRLLNKMMEMESLQTVIRFYQFDITNQQMKQRKYKGTPVLNQNLNTVENLQKITTFCCQKSIPASLVNSVCLITCNVRIKHTTQIW